MMRKFIGRKIPVWALSRVLQTEKNYGKPLGGIIEVENFRGWKYRYMRCEVGFIALTAALVTKSPRDISESIVARMAQFLGLRRSPNIRKRRIGWA
jgi:hypothetical protein